jgi:hypothetical protein
MLMMNIKPKWASLRTFKWQPLISKSWCKWIRVSFLMLRWPIYLGRWATDEFKASLTHAIWRMRFDACDLTHAFWHMRFDTCDLIHAIWHMRFDTCVLRFFVSNLCAIQRQNCLTRNVLGSLNNITKVEVQCSNKTTGNSWGFQATVAVGSNPGAVKITKCSLEQFVLCIGECHSGPKNIFFMFFVCMYISGEILDTTPLRMYAYICTLHIRCVLFSYLNTWAYDHIL